MKKSICFVFAMMSLGYGRVDNWELINYNNPGFTGSGVGIGFLDSVFNAQHPSLSGKTSVLGNGVDFGSTSYKDAYDLTHGTHVAAIAAGNAVDSHHGVAPDALIFGVSYLNPKYTFDKSANEIVNFLENSVKVVNNSWGLKYYYFMNKIIGVNNITFLDAYRDLTKAELQEGLNDIGLIANIQLAKKGILQVSSTGNEGQRTSNLNASYRAAYDNSLKAWIAVSAINNYFTTKTGNSFTLEKQQKNFKTDTVSDMNTYGFVGGYNSFSNSFKGIQSYAILAPGFQIESANAYYGQDLNEQWTYDRYICKADEFCPLSGTSQAAPFVSGAAALIAQKYSYVDGGVLADIILSTANANVTLPDLIIKSYKQSSNDTDTYYDVIYTNPNDISKINDKNKVKDDLKNQLGISDDQANYILTHLMNNINDANNNYAVYMSKEELIGQGILDIEKALKGLGKLDANRMTKNDIQAREGGKQAIYKINLNGGVTQFDNDISQEVWDQKWHDTSASTALKGIDKIGLEKTGGGTLILNGNNTYYGDTIVNGGTLKLTGGLTNSSVFAQNSGIFNLAGTASKDVTALNNGIVLLSSGTISGTLYSKNNGIIELQKGANINANSVNNAGILKGIGTINGDIINTGIVKAGFYDEVTDTTDKLGNLEVKGKFTQNTDGILQIAFTKSSETSSEVKNSTLSANSYDIKGSLVYVPLHTTASLIKANDKIQINLDSNNSNSSGSSHSLKDKLNDFTSVTAQSTNLLVFNIDNTDKTKLVAALKVTDGANADITKA
ncbi:S8 family serine peptidase, partial [Helicobacter equorum]